MQTESQPIIYKFEDDCYALLYNNLISNPEELYIKILSDIQFDQKYIKMYGKTIPLPRLTAFCVRNNLNIEYKYSGITNNAILWPSYFDSITGKLNELGLQLIPNCNIPNSCFLNYYRNGDDYIGWHSDDELKSYETNPIYSISLGSERTFEIRKKNNNNVHKILLKSGSLLVMYGSKFQQLYQHRLPKIEDSKILPRINLTFRFHDS